MPTYQYACTECDHAFEQLQSFTDDALTECPRCQGRLRKVFNAVGVVFKGSGFYRTDSRSEPKPESAPTDGGKASDSSGASSGEAKPKPSGAAADGSSDTSKPSAKPKAEAGTAS